MGFLQGIHRELRSPLIMLAGWALGSATWNAAGVLLVSQGGRPLGPTASALFAAVLVASAFGLRLAARRVPLLFGALGLLFAAACTTFVAGAINGQPSDWPSPFWRWAGAALNLVGVFGGLWAGWAAWRVSRMSSINGSQI